MAAQADDNFTRVLNENGLKELEIKIGGIYQLITGSKREVTELKKVVAENELGQMKTKIRRIHEMINVLDRATYDLKKKFNNM